MLVATANTSSAFRKRLLATTTKAPFSPPFFFFCSSNTPGVVFVVHGTQSRQDVGHSLVTLRSLKTPDFE